MSLNQITEDPSLKTCYKTNMLLDGRAKTWEDIQWAKGQVKLIQKANETEKEQERSDNLLNLFQSWGGPFNNIEELEEAEKTMKTEEKLRKMLRAEIQLRKTVDLRRGLDYTVNKKNNSELKHILCTILNQPTAPEEPPSIDYPTIQRRLQEIIKEIP